MKAVAAKVTELGRKVIVPPTEMTKLVSRWGSPDALGRGASHLAVDFVTLMCTLLFYPLDVGD